MSRPGGGRVRMLAAAVAALAGAACGGAAEKVVRPATEPLRSLPGMRQSAQVTSLQERGRLLDARLESEDFNLRFLFEDNDDCRELLRVGAEVQYAFVGPFGKVRGEDVTCEPIGVLSLAQWRDRKPRPSVPPLPRAQANFRQIYVDEELVFVRGRFPLASLVDFQGTEDLIAAVPRIPACEDPLEGGVASMEYMASGPDAFRLVSPEGTCPIEGLAIPQD